MRLLVSVVDPMEVAAALEGGADIIDVKDPLQGPLGAAGPGVLRAVQERVGGAAEWSAALGDAPHLPGTLALAAYGAARCGARYLKVGLLGSNRPAEARAMLEALQQAAEEAGTGARVIAVAYADHDRADGLPPAVLPAVALDAGVHGVMLDTAVKDGTSTFAALGAGPVSAFVDAACAAGLFVGLAGSLSVADAIQARALGVDVIGVRGSACEGGRGGRVSALRVRALREALNMEAPASPDTVRGAAAAAPAPGPAR